MPSQAQCEKCCATILAMLTDNTHWGQFMIGPISDAEKIIKTQLSEIVADHFSSKTGTNLEIPEKKSRGRPAGSPNSSPSIGDIRSSLKELGLSTSGKKAELKDRLSEALVKVIGVVETDPESPKKEKKEKKEKKKVEEPKKKGRKKGAKNKHPTNTKKNTAAATVIQARVRTLLAKNAYLAAQKKALVSKKKTKKSASKTSTKKKPTKKKTKSSQ